MTYSEAIRIAGTKAQAESLALSLSLNPHRNGPDEWRKLHAACIVLGPTRAPDRAIAVLMYHYAASVPHKESSE